MALGKAGRKEGRKDGRKMSKKEEKTNREDNLKRTIHFIILSFMYSRVLLFLFFSLFFLPFQTSSKSGVGQHA